MRLKGKTAIITGAASGFGRGIAIRFAEEGANVVIADINEENGLNVVDQISKKNGVSSFVNVDVSNSLSVKKMIEFSVEKYGSLDILVNNAGWAYSNRSSLDVSEKDFDKLISVNIKSLYLGTIYAVPVMRKDNKSGVIINIASTAAVRPRPNLTWYNATKGAAVTITKSLALELSSDNIRVCAINPVIGETGLLETFMGMKDTPKNREKFLESIPLGRFSKPKDIANAALFLASNEAEFLTGVCLDVDGGRSI